jgi:hypothetical protein
VYDGGDLWLSGWTTDGRLLVNQHVGIERSLSFLIDPATGRATPVFDDIEGGSVIRAVIRARTGPTMYVAADLGGEHVGLHAFDPATGSTRPLTPELRWDVEAVEALADGQTWLAGRLRHAHCCAPLVAAAGDGPRRSRRRPRSVGVCRRHR